METQERTMPQDVIFGWLKRRLGAVAMDRLEDERERLVRTPTRSTLFRLFDLAPRLSGKGALDLTQEETAEALAVQPDWLPAGWTLDQAARLAALLTAARLNDAEWFDDALETLFATADGRGLVALYQGLPLYPEPERLVSRAREGVRHAIVPVFQAVAQHNAFPARYFDEDGWNQMVLKAVFLDCRLDPIVGLDRRANAHLAAMLCDYVRERSAAGRTVPWDLWRCVDPFADAAAGLENLNRHMPHLPDPCVHAPDPTGRLP
jgi:hypothetical protein